MISSEEWATYRAAEVQLFREFSISDINYNERKKAFDQNVETLNATYGWTNTQIKDAFARSPKPVHKDSKINRALNIRYEWNFYKVTGKWNH